MNFFSFSCVERFQVQKQGADDAVSSSFNLTTQGEFNKEGRGMRGEERTESHATTFPTKLNFVLLSILALSSQTPRDARGETQKQKQ